MLLKEASPKVSLSPSPLDNGLEVECGTQIGFVKFNWGFKCAPVDYRDSARHFRSILVPAINLAAGNTADRSISQDTWNAFLNKTAKLETAKALPVEVPDLIHTEEEKEPVMETKPAPITPPAKTAAEVELERREELAKMLQQKPTEVKKKRKLI